MNKFIIILALFVATTGVASDLPSVNDRVQQQLQQEVPQQAEEQQPDQNVRSCKNMVAKYHRKVGEYSLIEHPTTGQKWKLDWYQHRLKYWVKRCKKAGQ